MSKLYVIICLFITLSKSQIAYPEDSPGNSNQSANGRVPVFIPGLCSDNEWYWPGNQESDWVCDCATGFVYFPSSERCYELYRRGPCKKDEYVILPKGKIIPECVKNPCKNDTIVPFNGNCYALYKTDACPSIHKLRGSLGVNYTTLELDCLPRSTAELHIIQVQNTSCPAGSKRSLNGQCRVRVRSQN